MMTLFFTATEQQLFQALPEVVKDGWIWKPEDREYHDTPHQLTTRLALTKSHSPVLSVLKEKVGNVHGETDWLSLTKEFHIDHLSHEDLLSICFVLGPAYISCWIVESLKSASNDDDLLRIAALTEIRHSLLSALLPNTSHA